VPNTTAILSILTTIQESIQPSKNELKRKFFENEAIKVGLPSSQTLRPINDASLSNHTATAFREWANRFEVPICDANVVTSVFGSLANIIDNCDKEETMCDLPLHDSTKLILNRFFNSTTAKSAERMVGMDDGYHSFSLNDLESMNQHTSY